LNPCTIGDRTFSLFAGWFQPELISQPTVFFLSQQTSTSRAYQPRNQPANRPFVLSILDFQEKMIKVKALFHFSEAGRSV